MSEENKDIVGFVLTTTIMAELEDKILDLIEESGHKILVGKGKPIFKSKVD